MAWVTTATSLISFGFTIYKFFQYLQEQQGPLRERAFGPRQYATLMIVIGLVALVFAAFQHRGDMKDVARALPRSALFAGDHHGRPDLLTGHLSLLGIVASSPYSFGNDSAHGFAAGL